MVNFFLCFTFVIQYRLDKLETKPDALTRRSKDLSKKGGGCLQ